MTLAASIVLQPNIAPALYEQLRLQIIAQVRAGELPSGARLPTVRALAADLEIAPHTVARAYKELEAGGVIVTRGKQGSFIAETGDVTREQAQRAAVEYVRAARALGFDDAATRAMVDAALRVDPAH
ncbi:GntR family transcriptional regulator [Tomitella biformata]|uniref:GntR family transcriptional regulator n=1 Tax=Tomitella biformata TaxID=630403 RepID=UPI0004663EF7|nr:GntR family transcriptional regulator [Tomitella biformata]